MKYKVGDIVKVKEDLDDLDGVQAQNMFHMTLRDFLKQTGVIKHASVPPHLPYQVQFTVLLNINFNEDELEPATEVKAFRHD